MDNKKDTSTPQSYELVNFCEFDKFAEQSYCAVHGVDASLNLGDITKVDETKIKPFSMICGGSPCQDFSVAGKGEGSKWKCKDCEHEYNPLTLPQTLCSFTISIRRQLSSRTSMIGQRKRYLSARVQRAFPFLNPLSTQGMTVRPEFPTMSKRSLMYLRPKANRHLLLPSTEIRRLSLR